MKSKKYIYGFSLVEVALSLGVVAFALTGVFGLLGVGINSGKASLEDTVLATMTNEVVSELRQQSFVDATHQPGPGVLPGTAPAAPEPATDPSKATPLATMYFDDSGARLRDPNNKDPNNYNSDYTSSTAALQAGAVYQCTASGLPDLLAADKGGTLGATDVTTGLGQVNLVNVTLVFRWPVAAVAAGSVSNSTASPTPSQNGSRTIHASLARY